MNKTVAISIIVLVLYRLVTPNVEALGTPAGTPITGRATATYTVKSITGLTTESNVLAVTVVELLDFTVVWRDASEVLVSPGDAEIALTFLLSNTGNGSDSFTLGGMSTVGGDDFDPSFLNIYLDTNGNDTYDPGVDSAYVPGVNDPHLALDQSVTVFVTNDIPDSLLDGSKGDTQLTVTSNSGTGAPGTVLAGGGEGGTDAVIGVTSGQVSVRGTYIAFGVQVNLVKTVSISDPFGGSQPFPGSRFTYSIVVDVSGDDTAEDVVITDFIPANTTYEEGTLSLDTQVLSDNFGDDEGEVLDTDSDSVKDKVTVRLGNLLQTSPTRTIAFQVIVN